jgi:hypothetical protein
MVSPPLVYALRVRSESRIPQLALSQGRQSSVGVPCEDERPQLFLEKEKSPLDPLLAGGVGLKDTVIVEELAVFLTVSDGVASRAPRSKVAIDLLVEEPRPIGRIRMEGQDARQPVGQRLDIFLGGR